MQTGEQSPFPALAALIFSAWAALVVVTVGVDGGRVGGDLRTGFVQSVQVNSRLSTLQHRLRSTSKLILPFRTHQGSNTRTQTHYRSEDERRASRVNWDEDDLTDNLRTILAQPDPEIIYETKKRTYGTSITLYPDSAAFKAVYQYPNFNKSLSSSFEIIPTPVRNNAGMNTRISSSLRLTLGSGTHKVKWQGAYVHINVEEIGPPVGTNHGPQMYRRMEVWTEEPGTHDKIKSFLDHAIKIARADSDDGTLKSFRWDYRTSRWVRGMRCLKRPLASVVIEREQMQAVLNDLRGFLSGEDWYKRHGIPYKRGYIFHGPPGTGKTSLIRALASHFDLSLCHLHIANEKCEDEILKKAIDETPPNSVIILEDVDAFFRKDRISINQRSPLTFSGLLNALDGLGSQHGQILAMTTNHIERLDPALIRAGRCDFALELNNASQQQVQNMFLRFHPGHIELARIFAANVAKFNRKISPAELQNHFIIHRESPAEIAANDLRFDHVLYTHGGERTA